MLCRVESSIFGKLLVPAAPPSSLLSPARIFRGPYGRTDGPTTHTCAHCALSLHFRLRMEDGVKGGAGETVRCHLSLLFPPPHRPLAVSSFRGTSQFKASCCWRLSVQGNPVGFDKCEIVRAQNLSKSQGGAVEERRLPPLCWRSTLPLPLPSKHFTPSYTFWSWERWKVSLEGRSEEHATNEMEREGEFRNGRGGKERTRKGNGKRRRGATGMP